MNTLTNATVASLTKSSNGRNSWTADDVIGILSAQQKGATREEACKAVGRSVASYQTCVRPKLKKIFEKVSQLPESEQNDALQSEIRATFK